jgi:hypothetical protein
VLHKLLLTTALFAALACSSEALARVPRHQGGSHFRVGHAHWVGARGHWVGGHRHWVGGYGGRFWHGRRWAHGAGPCWRWSPYFGRWSWVCYGSGVGYGGYRGYGAYASYGHWANGYWVGGHRRWVGWHGHWAGGRAHWVGGHRHWVSGRGHWAGGHAHLVGGRTHWANWHGGHGRWEAGTIAANSAAMLSGRTIAKISDGSPRTS